MLAVLLALVTFAAAALGDVAEARFVQHVTGGRAHAAARMSVVMYVVGFAGWVVTVKISLWYCVPEVAGLYLGTLWATRRRAS